MATSKEGAIWTHWPCAWRLEPGAATGRAVTIAEQYFFYKTRDDQIVEIRPDPVPGGAPGGILEQIGVAKTTL